MASALDIVPLAAHGVAGRDKFDAFSFGHSSGDGYFSDVKVHKKRAVGRAYPGTAEARHDNYENNTLLKAIGG